MRGLARLIHRVVGVAMLAAVVWPNGQARGDEASFDPDGTDKEVSLRATIETRPVEASGQIRVVLRGTKGTVKVRLNPLQDGSAAGKQIPASQITVEEKVVERGPVTPLGVTIKGIDRPGTYQGTLNLSLAPAEGAAAHAPVAGQPGAAAQPPVAGQPGAAAQPPVAGQPAPITTRDVKLTLYVLVKPQIESPDASVAVSFSNCTCACGFAELVAPGSLSGDQARVTVINKSPTPLTVTGRIDLKGATRTRIVQSVNAKNEVTIAAGGREPILFPFPREKFGADHFTGSVILTARAPNQPTLASVGSDGAITSDNQAMLTIPATVDVRDGALVAFLVILAGVFVGRLGAILGSASRNARIALYAQYLDLSAQIEALVDPDAKTHCQQQLTKIWSHLLKEDATDPKFGQQFKDLANEIELFNTLAGLKIQLTTITDTTRRNDIQGELDKAKNALLDDPARLDDAKKALKDAQSKITTPLVTPSMAASFAKEVEEAARTIDERKAIEKKPPAWQRVIGTVVRFVSGTDTTDTIAFQALVLRPLVWLVSIIVLSFYGLWLFYGGTDHATFGAKGLSEYIALFLWGIAAHTVSLTLADIQFTRRSAPG